ncbi:MAG: FAD-binding protein [Acidobacteria bacterium]|nr:MAG: FAD-binding protein [Acidobacteriota bacterium]
MNRRRFLFAVFAALLHRRSAAEGTRAERVVVIGAGAAGLGAAAELQRAGYSVLVIEARDRLGGRIFTDRSLGAPVDLGATWIQGRRGNPISELAARFGVEVAPATDYDDVALFDRGRPVDLEILARYESELQELLAELERYSRGLEEDVSIASGLAELLRDEELTPFEERLLAWFLETLALDAAASADERSLLYADDEGFGGGDHLFPGGYEQIVHGLARGLEVRRGERVRRIALRQGGVRVETDRASHDADRAVVTLPLGVLKASPGEGGVSFDPPLPEWKRRAISRLAMGTLDKVALRFPEVFWPAHDLLGNLDGAGGGLPVFLNLAPHLGAPILVAFSAGPGARRREERSDEAIAGETMEVLRTMAGEAIPAPERLVATRWHRDPFAGGSYSFVPVGARGEDYEALAEPVAGRLFFAGEATNRSYPATVHGAYLSGLREAKRIAALT